MKRLFFMSSGNSMTGRRATGACNTQARSTRSSFHCVARVSNESHMPPQSLHPRLDFLCRSPTGCRPYAKQTWDLGTPHCISLHFTPPLLMCEKSPNLNLGNKQKHVWFVHRRKMFASGMCRLSFTGTASSPVSFA